MHETKTLLTVVSLLFALLAYIPYFKDIFKGKTRPHAFTWLVWCVMSTVAFFSQVSDGAGVGAWVLAFTAVANFAIFCLAIYKGETRINAIDWFCLMGSFLGVALFTFNQDPPMSLVIISAVDIIGFVPTVRKSLVNPYQETASTFTITSLKYIFSIFALENYTLITVMYPAVVGSMHAFFVLILLNERRKFTLAKKLKAKKAIKKVAPKKRSASEVAQAHKTKSLAKSPTRRTASAKL